MFLGDGNLMSLGSLSYQKSVQEKHMFWRARWYKHRQWCFEQRQMNSWSLWHQLWKWFIGKTTKPRQPKKGEQRSQHTKRSLDIFRLSLEHGSTQFETLQPSLLWLCLEPNPNSSCELSCGDQLLTRPWGEAPGAGGVCGAVASLCWEVELASEFSALDSCTVCSGSRGWRRVLLCCNGDVCAGLVTGDKWQKLFWRWNERNWRFHWLG